MSGTAPSPRQASAVCIGHGNLMFVHGGRNNFVLEDLHMLDWVTRTWTEISCVGRMPPPRHSHLTCMHKDQLYLFGGLDELGAQSFAMYRLNLPPGESYVATKPEWLEWDSELPYNKCRSCTLFNGTISVYQLGSNTLGRVNDEDAEKGLVYWDVFKSAKLEATKVRALAEEELRPKNAKRMRVAHTINISAKMPRSFNVHTPHEAKVLAYVQDYQRIFEELYPHRRPLYLTPKNECNVPKLVCSTLRPTQLVYTELYDLDGCCSFVADFVAYESLEDPLHPPEYLPSPMSVLNHQAGDCFDLAGVLCSLLIGVGYNAFVVVGYAPLAVTTNDQTQTLCPVLERERRAAAANGGVNGGVNANGKSSVEPGSWSNRVGSASTNGNHGQANGGGASGKRGASAAAGARKASAAESEKAPAAASNKYLVKPLGCMESKVVKAREEREAKEEAARAEVEAAEAEAEALEMNGTARSSVLPDATGNANGRSALYEQALGLAPPPPSLCRTVHAWVLVMAGKRDVTEHFFVEPSTGRRYPVTACPYEGVEYMWNHRNFWVCMQQPEPHSDSRAHPKDVTYDLGNPNKWEPVFEDKSGRAQAELSLDELDLRTLENRGAGTRSFVRGDGNAGLTATLSKPKTPTAGTRPNSVAANGLGGTLVSKMKSVKSQGGANGAGSDVTPPRTAESHIDYNDGGDYELCEPEWVPDRPPSWVPKLSIPRDAFDMRCPRGSKLQLYHRSQHEIFALFGDCSRWDGMVDRLIIFEDDDRTQVAEIREAFQRRKDKLRERRVYPKKEMSMEYFDAGSSFGLKDILTVKNERRTINFYHSARLDGLMQREEEEGHKMIETFLNRDDRLVYRSATYMAEGSRASDVGEGDNILPDDDVARRARKLKARDVKKVLSIGKMTEKFARNPDLNADNDVAKRVYYLAESRILMDYHFGENRITNSSRTYHKDGQSQIVQVDPLADRPEPGALLEEYQGLLVAERDCMQAVRDSEWEVSEILRTRTNQEQNITLEMPYYDIVRIKAEESEEEEEEVAESAYDYLSPFLPTLLGTATLSREQALDTREKCLKALKDRLIERANIIQARLDEESGALAKRQANFNRDRDQMSAEEEEEYERAVEESLFRIHILEKRLKRHEDQALHKYYELDHKLRSDGRLSALLSQY